MPLAVLFAYLGAAGAGALALWTAVRAGRSIPRWSFVAGMALLAIETGAAGACAQADSLVQAEEWQQVRLMAESALPAAWLLFSLTYARGARPLNWRRTMPVLAAAGLPVAWWLFRPGVLPLVDGTSTETAFRLPWSGMILQALVLLGAVAIVLNLERTFRASVGTIRWGIKFMLLAVGLIFIARIYTASQHLVFRMVDTSLSSINSAALLIAIPLVFRAFGRSGHFEMDVYPSSSVLQGSVTVLLAGLYLLLIGAFAQAATYFGGDAAFTLKAFLVLVALVAFAVVVQSDRARQQLRRFVSRHFQRPLHDYRLVWQKFAAATNSRVDQGDLAQAIAVFVADILEALSVNVWVISEKGDTLIRAASTAPSSGNGTAAHDSLPANGVIAYFQAKPEPIEFEANPAPWAEALRRLHPVRFPNGGRRYCAPLASQGDILGLITIGDRVGGTPLSLEDRDLLQCIAGHAASSLMNVQLAQRLMQARELEAFQAMAAFFVHDLKNAASTLKLMLQNLPVHFDNPEFRADALRGIGRTVSNINGLISRLSQLRRALKLELAEGDLNEVVSAALANLEPPPGVSLVREMQPVPRVPLDGEQMNKVVTNLVLNASEAVSNGGRVRVATARDTGWVVLTVADNGCGMTEEFVNQSLFRPFQSTKPRGLGIGMFQSKMIVEAHGGRITVTSRPGEGTTFQVFLREPASR